MPTATPSAPIALGLQPSFGFGDRIGLATPGHVAALQRAGTGILPIFAQQSIREMTRTGRSPETVMHDALRGMQAAGWRGATGADADHLKTREDVDRTAAAGFVMFTIDPSGYVDAQADHYPAADLRERYKVVRAEVSWAEAYRGKRVALPNGTPLSIDDTAMMRAAVKYGRAVNAAVELAAYIRLVQTRAGREHEIELSVDETDQPTTLAEHYIVAAQCIKGGMKLVSLAPRFVGSLEKGVDYIGDLAALEQALRDHAAVAEVVGPYKLSLHSGSDKLSMYTAFARATQGRFHVKTAGTSYLEALRVAALEEPALFRRLCAFARERYDVDKATYHVHATLADVPPPDALRDDKALERAYLECWDDVAAGKGFTAPGRQILHCTFGSVLTHEEFGPALRACLTRHPTTYRDVLAVHFDRHLQALLAGM
ncbi:MAG: tagaturonate epimerase family protein [Lentisphaerae bacterium]|nr:tagaturonate epimerase family protein [Lentisphaerota bacterium]